MRRLLLLIAVVTMGASIEPSVQRGAVATHSRSAVGAKRDARLFFAPFSTTGISRLPSDITINGQTVSPMLRFVGKDATATEWTSTGGDSLAIVGTAPDTGQPAPFLDDSKAVEGSGTAGQYYKATDANFGQLGRKDGVWEFVLRADGSADSPGCTYDGTSGWFTLVTAGSYFRLYLDDGPNQKYVSASLSGNPAGAWVYIMCWADLDYASGLACSVNGGAPVIVNPTTVTGDINGGLMALLAGSSGAYVLDGGLALLSMWGKGDLLDGSAAGTAEMQALAKSRFEILTGIDDSKGHEPTFARASTATTTIGSDLFTVGKNWARLEDDGYLSEPAATNLCLHSQAFDDASWVGSTVTADDATAPDGTATADKITASSSGILQSITVSTGAEYTGGLWLKAAASVNVPVVIDGTSTNAAVTTEWQKFGSTVASSSGTNIDFGLGVGTYTVWVWGAQVEEGSTPSSYIATTTAAVTRKADVMTYTISSLPSTAWLRYDLDGSAQGELLSSSSVITYSDPTLTIATGHHYQELKIYNSAVYS